VDDPREIGQRARRLERSLPPFLQNFDGIWGHMREEIDQGLDYFRGVDLSALSLADLRRNLIQGRRYLKRTAEIHFQVMYPLLANYAGFYSMCGAGAAGACLAYPAAGPGWLCYRYLGTVIADGN